MHCSVLTAVVLYLSMGYTLSDAYEVPSEGFVALDPVLQLLEAPFVMVLRLLYLLLYSLFCVLLVFNFAGCRKIIETAAGIH